MYTTVRRPFVAPTPVEAPTRPVRGTVRRRVEPASAASLFDVGTREDYLRLVAGKEIPNPFVVTTAEQRQKLANILNWSKGCITTDTEGSGGEGYDIKKMHPRYFMRATSVQFTTDEFPAIYLDNWKENEGSIQLVKSWLEDASKPKDFHNAKFDAHVFANHGMTLRGLEADTIVMDYLLDTSREGRHDLETCAFDWGITPTILPSYRDTFSYFPLTKKGVPSKKAVVKPHMEWWEEVPEGWTKDQYHPNKQKVVNYACKDTRVTRLVRAHHEAALRKIPWGTKTYWDYYKMIELPFTTVLLNMELRGMVVDVPHLEALHLKFEKEIQAHGREFFRRLSAAGIPASFLEGANGEEGFNPKSSQQLAELLYGKLGYRVPKYTDGTKDGSRARKRGEEPTPSVDEEALLDVQQQMIEAAKDEVDRRLNLGIPDEVDITEFDVLEPLLGTPVPGLDPIPGKRELEKLDNTYAVGLVAKAKVYRGRVHSNLNQIGTATMRLSSSKPNLQNIPTRSAIGRELRKAFIAPPGCVIHCVDYSQIELRVAAHKYKEPVMCKYFLEGKDPHSLTAYSLFDEIREDVDARFGTIDSKEAQKYVKTTYEDMRGRGKTWNFMVIYGGGIQRAMSVFAVTEEEAVEKIELFFATYPGVRAGLNRAIAYVMANGHIRTLLGRYCHIPGARDPKFGVRKAAERQAGNYEIQGSAGDIVKLAMILIENDPELKAMEYVMVMQIHDEILGYGPEEHAEATKERKQYLMANACELMGFKPLIVPTLAEGNYGANWHIAKH